MPKLITKESLEEFRNWLLARASDNTMTTNHITAQALSGSAAKMTEWFDLEPQIPDSSASVTNRDKAGLHWIRKEHCDYVLQNVFGYALGAIVGESSSTGRDARLRFCAKHRVNGDKWFVCGYFDNIVDAKEAVEVSLSLTQPPGPLPNPPGRPLWLQSEGLAQLFNFDGLCVGIVKKRLSDNHPSFLAEVRPAEDQWIRVGYLENEQDAKRLAELKFRSLKTQG